MRTQELCIHMIEDAVTRLSALGTSDDIAILKKRIMFMDDHYEDPVASVLKQTFEQMIVAIRNDSFCYKPAGEE